MAGGLAGLGLQVSVGIPEGEKVVVSLWNDEFKGSGLKQHDVMRNFYGPLLFRIGIDRLQ